MLYVLLHRYPFYPYTGSPRVVGEGEGEGAGFTVNVGWSEGGLAPRSASQRLRYPSVHA